MYVNKYLLITFNFLISFIKVDDCRNLQKYLASNFLSWIYPDVGKTYKQIFTIILPTNIIVCFICAFITKPTQ